MRTAFRFTSAFKQPLYSEDGELIPGDSGRYLLKRLMGLFDDPILIGDESRQASGFEVKPLRRIDPNQTVVVTFDVLDALALHQEMKTWVGAFPKITNFVWWNVSELMDEQSRLTMAASCGAFPTFCNSARTEQEVRDVVRRYMAGSVVRKQRVSHAPLGIDVSVPPLPRVIEDRPVVLYPAMWLFARKNPDRFLEMTRHAAAAGCRIVAALSEHALESEKANQFRAAGVDVTGLVPRDEYRWRLASADVFLATSQDESYGLQYVEAMFAGVVGVFPRRPWVFSIVPPDYPFLYGSQQEGEALLYYVVKEREEARKLVAYMPDWIRENHDRDAFERSLKKQVSEWWVRD